MQDAHRAAAGRDAVQFSRLALLAASVMILAPSLASAQTFDPLRGYSFDGSPVGAARAAPPPRGREYQVREEPSERQSPMFMSSGRIRRLAAQQGYRLDSSPHRRGHSIFAVAENDSGHRFQLVFNAYTGAIVGQRDLGPVAVAKSTPGAAPAAPGAPVVAAAPPAVAVPDSAEIIAARADVEKAAAAEADARRVAEARAAESRQAQAKLADIQTAARRAAEAKLAETRRQEALAAEQRRNDEHFAEVKRQALTAAEAKLAEAKAAQARAESEIKQAEADAAKARAAIEPAKMATTTQKPAELAPADKDSPAPSRAASQETGKSPAEAAAAAKQPEQEATTAKQPDTSTRADAAVVETTGKPTAAQVPPVAPDGAASLTQPQTTQQAEQDHDGKPSQAAADATDASPTGSMKPKELDSSASPAPADQEHP